MYEILREGHFKTVGTSFSNNCDHVFYEIAEWASEICRATVNEFMHQGNYKIIRTEEKPHDAIHKGVGIPWLIKLIIKWLRGKFLYLFIYEQWNIGYIESSLEKVMQQKRLSKIVWLFPKKKEAFYADPFIIKNGAYTYIFGEKYVFKKRGAKIFSARLEQGKIKEETDVFLNVRHHVSYPCIFEWEDNLFLCLEEWKTRTISLYKAIDFPVGWIKLTTLIDNIDAVDPTVFRHNGLWWLFFTKKSDEPETKLFAYYSKDLLGDWEPHKRNPIKIDVRSSRPAGKIFCYKGQLIRPSQDCSRFYGWRIALNKIVHLSPYYFEEETIKTIDASGFRHYNKGTHTFNHLGNYIILDGLRYFFSFKKPLRKIII